MDQPRLPRPAHARAPGRERLPDGEASAGDGAEAAEGPTHQPDWDSRMGVWRCGSLLAGARGI
jgi:hypothetical protein